MAQQQQQPNTPFEREQDEEGYTLFPVNLTVPRGGVVRLSNVNIREFGEEAFSTWTLRIPDGSFQWLSLGNNPISKIKGFEQIIVRTLQTLTLNMCHISRIEGLPRLRNLDTLDLSYNRISKIEGLEELRSLKNLYLHTNKIEKIEGLENLTGLTYISLHYNRISKIEGLDGLVNLYQIYLGSNPIKLIHVSSFENCGSPRGLVVSLSNCPLETMEGLMKENTSVRLRNVFFNSRPGGTLKVCAMNAVVIRECVKNLNTLIPNETQEDCKAILDNLPSQSIKEHHQLVQVTEQVKVLLAEKENLERELEEKNRNLLREKLLRQHSEQKLRKYTDCQFSGDCIAKALDTFTFEANAFVLFVKTELKGSKDPKAMDKEIENLYSCCIKPLDDLKKVLSPVEFNINNVFGLLWGVCNEMPFGNESHTQSMLKTIAEAKSLVLNLLNEMKIPIDVAASKEEINKLLNQVELSYKSGKLCVSQTLRLDELSQEINQMRERKGKLREDLRSVRALLEKEKDILEDTRILSPRSPSKDDQNPLGGSKLESFEKKIKKITIALVKCKSERKKKIELFEKILSEGQVMDFVLSKYQKLNRGPFEHLLFQNGVLADHDASFDDYTDKMFLQQNQGKVYKCRKMGDPLKKWRIVKILEYNVGTSLETRAFEEIKHLLSLDHPSIIRINEVFLQVNGNTGTCGVDMDFAGIDLLNWLKSEEEIAKVEATSEGEETFVRILELPNKRKLTNVKAVFRKTLVALAYIHSRGVEHRDLKPQNIVVNDLNEVKLIDFGISKNSVLSTMTVFKSAGTPRYAAPEQKRVAKSDVFSLGRIMFECFCRSADVDCDPLHPEFVKNMKSSMEYLGGPLIELLAGMLDHDVESRLTAAQCMSSCFFDLSGGSDLPVFNKESVMKLIEMTSKARKEVDPSSWYEALKWVRLDRSVSDDETQRKKSIVMKYLGSFWSCGNLKDLVSAVRFNFEGENANGPGVTREAFTEFCIQLTDENLNENFFEELNGLFLPTKEKSGESDKKYFRMFGMFLCKCLYENTPLPINFGSLFWMELLGCDREIEKLFSNPDCPFGEEYGVISIYKQMIGILEESNYEDVHNNPECYTFIHPESRKKVLLCRENKNLFLSVKIHEELYGRVGKRKENFDAICEGFYEHMGKDIMRFLWKSVNYFSLMKFMMGNNNLTADLLLSNIKWDSRPQAGETTNKFIERWIQEASPEERLLFVRFCTGLSSIPIDGVLKGQDSKEKKIVIVHDDSKSCFCVKSHTCHFQLIICVHDEEYDGFKRKFTNCLNLGMGAMHIH